MSEEKDGPAVEPEVTVEDDSPVVVLPPVVLTGSYRVIHGSITLGDQNVAPRGTIVQLSDEDAAAMLLAKIIERV